MYELNVVVPMSLCGPSGKMNINTVTMAFQDIVSYNVFGYTADKQFEQNFMWYLISWRVSVTRYPRCEERVRIRTHLNKIEGFFCIRTFSVIDADDNVIAVGTCNYAYANRETGKVSRMTSDFINDHEIDEETTCEFMPFGNRLHNTQGEKIGEIKVMRHDVDINRHTNNISYIRMALDLLPIDYDPTFLEIYYEKPSFYGDVLEAYESHLDGKKILTLKKEDTTIVTVVLGTN